MADRYWVGGTASWDGTAGTKWALTSGGTGGQAVPTTADDVFFDAASGANTVTVTASVNCRNLNFTGFTGTFAGNQSVSVYGTIVTVGSGMTWTHSSTLGLRNSCTFTSNGKTITSNIQILDSSTVQLADALTSTGVITLTIGNFTTNNFNVTATSIIANNTNVRTINLGSSTVTLTAPTAINFTNPTNLTFNSGTSQINVNNASSTIQGGAQIFYNVSFTNTNVGTRFIVGANTFNNLTLNASATGLSQLSLSDNQTINGTFTCAGSSVTARGFVRSDTIGTTRTITANAISANDCDFRDITLAGTASGASPTRAGDCGNNSGITFPAAKTVYWNLAGNQNWSATGWATSSGTSPALNNFPLPQDTAVFDDAGAITQINTGSTYNIGSINFSNRTSSVTFNNSAVHNIYGDFIFGSGVTCLGTAGLLFIGFNTKTFTSAGKTITFPISVLKVSSAFELGDATITSNTITLTQGTFDAKNYNLTCTTFASSNSNTRTINMGFGLWTLSGTGTVWTLATPTNLTFNKDTANILLSNTTTTARSFDGGGLIYNKLTIGGATGISTLTLSGINTFSEIASTKTVAHTITFSANQTITTWTVTGTSGNVVTVNSSAVGTRRTITLTNVTNGIDYLSVKDIGITDTNRFYVGANSTDGGNNLNVIFTASPAVGQSSNYFLLF